MLHGQEILKYGNMLKQLCILFSMVLMVSGSFSEIDSKKMEEKSLLLLSRLKVPNNLRIQASEDPIDSISTISSEYDLLILGAPEKDNWIRILLGTGRDKFTENSACSVLRLTTKNEK